MKRDINMLDTHGLKEQLFKEWHAIQSQGSELPMSGFANLRLNEGVIEIYGSYDYTDNGYDDDDLLWSDDGEWRANMEETQFGWIPVKDYSNVIGDTYAGGCPSCGPYEVYSDAVSEHGPEDSSTFDLSIIQQMFDDLLKEVFGEDELSKSQKINLMWFMSDPRHCRDVVITDISAYVNRYHDQILSYLHEEDRLDHYRLDDYRITEEQQFTKKLERD